MAVIEKSGLLTYKDADGNKTIMYPITKKDCVEGLENLDETLSNKSDIYHTHSYNDLEDIPDINSLELITEAEIDEICVLPT